MEARAGCAGTLRCWRSDCPTSGSAQTPTVAPCRSPMLLVNAVPGDVQREDPYKWDDEDDEADDEEAEREV